MSLAQEGTSDAQLAAHYFQTGDFEKAVLYYEKLYNTSSSDFYYTYLRKSYIELEQYKLAEKLIKKQIKRFEGNVTYYVDLGVIYRVTKTENKAKQLFDKAIKDLQPQQNKINRLARTFINIDENTYALNTYLKGQKLLKGRYPFNLEIAEIYGLKRDFTAMINEYLDLIEFNEAYLQTVQNRLSRAFSFDKKTKQNQILKTELLKRVQRNSSKTIFSEMLIWQYIQHKNFDSAFIQAKALDKRNNEKGGRLIALGTLCMSNKNYDVAIKSYEYIIQNKKPENYFYTQAKIDLLGVLNKKITETLHYTDIDLISLENQYKKTIQELGKSSSSIPLIRDLAHLEAYYLHQPDTAIILLKEAIDIRNASTQLRAECKLDLGDILLIKGEIWDASLYYSQVDKAFKYDELGERAKFKNAEISYYTGNFKFAKGQLDVLKGSTSKLIANDALNLSLLITDNTGIDTTEYTMQLYAKAELLIIENKDSLAFSKLDSITKVFPGHSLSDEVLYLKYKMTMNQKKFGKAADFLQQIINQYSTDILADDAIFHLAELNQNYLGNEARAKSLYEKLLFEYQGSLYVVEARKRYRKLRGENSD